MLLTSISTYLFAVLSLVYRKGVIHILALKRGGPSGEAQTHDPVIPNHVRYQLRYTRILT